MYKWLTLDTINGVRKRVRVYGKSEAEIKRNMNQKLREYQGVMESRETFGNYKQIWFECKDKREAATKEMYENAMRKTSSIDDMKLSEIRTSDLQKIINVNFEHSRSCAILRQFLNQVYQSAIREGIVAKNPVHGLELPTSKRKEKRALTKAERTAIRETKLTDKERLFVEIMYYFGLRPGECLALTKDDFGEVLNIDKAIGYDKNSPYVKPTKTNVSRTIPIPDAFQLEIPEGRLFEFTKSGYYDMWHSIKDKINRYLGGDEHLDLTPGLHPYIFRHDYCTRCFYAGISALMTAKLMGNSVKMVLEVYSHLEEENEALNKLKKMSL